MSQSKDKKIRWKCLSLAVLSCIALLLTTALVVLIFIHLRLIDRMHHQRTTNNESLFSIVDKFIEFQPTFFDKTHLQSVYYPPTSDWQWYMIAGNYSLISNSDFVGYLQASNDFREVSSGRYWGANFNNEFGYAIAHKATGAAIYIASKWTLNQTELTQMVGENQERNMALTRVCGHQLPDNSIVYTTLWEEIENAESFVDFFDNINEIYVKNDHLTDQNFHIKHICAYETTDIGIQFVAVWQKEPPTTSSSTNITYQYFFGLPLSDCLVIDENLQKERNVPILFQVYTDKNATMCMGIWQSIDDDHESRIEIGTDLQQMFQHLTTITANSKLKPRQISHFIDSITGHVTYVVLWSDFNQYTPKSKPLWSRTTHDWHNSVPIPKHYLVDNNQQQQNNGEKFRFIEQMIEKYMRTNKVPGMSLALTVNESLIYAIGAGYANIRTKEEVDPFHRFRIASISKPITATAIFLLIDQGKLALDRRVFGNNSIFGNIYGSRPYNESLTNITVRHLLEHTSGIGHIAVDGALEDPVWQAKELSIDALISYTIDNIDQKPPDTEWEYSNFGYLLLGRIVEIIDARRDFETFVNEEIWSLCGVNDAVAANKRISERADDEVIYYMEQSCYKVNGDPYNLVDKQRLLPFAGWVVTPIQLLQFMVRVDGFQNKADILKSADIEMWSIPTNLSRRTYGMGWSLYDMGFNGWSHDGHLPGTSAWLIRLDNGISAAIAVNKNSQNDAFFYELAFMLNHIITSNGKWPQTSDLFEKL